MAVKTKHTFSATTNNTTRAFSGHGIELNNLDDLDVYVTLSGGTRVLQNRNALTNETAQSSHPQVSNTDGLYFPAVSAGTPLYNYQLTTANDTITFNSDLPSGAIVTVERRTRDASSAYTTFAGGSTIRHTDLNRSATESNYTAQEGRNKAFELEGKIFGDAAKDSSFITSADIVDGTIVAADLASNSVTTAKIQDDAVTAAKLAHTSVTAGNYTAADITVDAQGRLTSASSGTISASEIAGDAINGDKIADNSINSEHYVDGSIDTVHLADDSVTDAKLAAGAIGTNGLANGAVTTPKLAADAINGDKIADNSINSEHYVDGSIDRIHIGDNQINTAKLADNAVETANILDNNVTLAKLGSGALPTDITVNADNLVANSVGTSEIATDAVTETKIANSSVSTNKIAAGAVTTGRLAVAAVTEQQLANDAVTSTKLADNAVDTEHIAADAVTTSEIADAELKTLAGMQSGTASNLASSTALAATTGEINTICDGKSVETTISDTDAAYPTSGAVVDYVAAQIAPLGGLEVIATDAVFPNTQPAAGVVISIADAGGLVVNGSGTSTTGRTVGGSTVTINNINSQFNSTTVDNGVAMMVSSTGSGQIYNYHKATLKEADLLSLSGDINDFAERYRVAGSAPSSSLDEGDLWWDTATDKLKVYDGSSWDEVASSGDFYINTISSYSGTGGNSATFNGSAYRFVLSNPGSTAQQHIVSINGVIQKPNSGTSQPSEGFAIDGSSIIFSNAPVSGSDYFILTIGTAVSIGTPSDNTVSTAKIQNLAVTGDKIATNLDLADDKKIRFGTGNDIEIFHDGTWNWIDAVNNHGTILRAGTGDLFLQGGNVNIGKENAVEFSLKAISDGAVQLYNDNSEKFATTSTGIRITPGGSIASVWASTETSGDNFIFRVNKTGTDATQFVIKTQASGGSMSERMRIDSSGRLFLGTDADISGGSNASIVQVVSSSGSYLSVGRNDTTVASGNGLGGFRFYSNDTNINSGNYLQVGGISCDADGDFLSGDAPTRLTFSTMTDGTTTLAERMRIDSNGSLGLGLIDPHLYYAKQLVVKAPSEGGITIRNTGANDWNYIMFASGDSSSSRYSGWIGYDHGDNLLKIGVNDDVSGKGFKFKADGNLEISDGNLVVANGHGIDFSAQTATSATGAATTSGKETLDHYEEGTWTPVLNKVSVAGTITAAYTRYASYVKVGNMLWISFYLQINSSSWGTGTGQWYISGLPFSLESATAAGYQSIPVGYFGLDGAEVNQTTEQARLQANNQGGNPATLTMYASGSKTNWTTSHFWLSASGFLKTQ